MYVSIRSRTTDHSSRSRGKHMDVRAGTYECLTANWRDLYGKLQPCLRITGRDFTQYGSGVRGGTEKSTQQDLVLELTESDLRKIMQHAANAGMLPIRELQDAYCALSVSMEKLNLVMPPKG